MKISQIVLPLLLISLLALTGCSDPKKTATQQHWNALRGSYMNFSETVALAQAKMMTPGDPMAKMQDTVIESKNIAEAAELLEKNLSSLPKRNVDEELIKQTDELVELARKTNTTLKKMQNLVSEMYQLSMDLQNLFLNKKPEGADANPANVLAQLAAKNKRLEQLPAEGEVIQGEAFELYHQAEQIPQKMEQLRSVLNKKYQLELLPFVEDTPADAASKAAPTVSENLAK